jgi:hypothetical protein
MATLDRWRWLLRTPVTLTFPHLKLIGRDHDPPIIVGTGEVRMESSRSIKFTLRGVPSDARLAMAQINQQREKPYDILAQARLIGTDSSGINWNGGYTVPKVDISNHGEWSYFGDLNSLFTDDKDGAVSKQQGTELIYLLRIGDPMTLALSRYVRTEEANEKFSREYKLEVLQSSIGFKYDADASVLSVTASESSELNSVYAQGWLGEPLRILFGQLIYPSLVARNFGDGRASVRIGRCPDLVRGARWAALWQWKKAEWENDEFWRTYIQILTFVAKSKGTDGRPNFEPNTVTRFYEEIIQAARGSRWVWALTFAIVIEGLARMLIPQDRPSANDPEIAAIDALAFHINLWPGDARLKQTAVNAITRTAVATGRVLRDLCKSEVITKAQYSAWEKIRHSVAHGTLLSPYSNEEEDKALLTLSDMMHSLTREILRRPTMQ